MHRLYEGTRRSSSATHVTSDTFGVDTAVSMAEPATYLTIPSGRPHTCPVYAPRARSVCASACRLARWSGHPVRPCPLVGHRGTAQPLIGRQGDTPSQTNWKRFNFVVHRDVQEVSDIAAGHPQRRRRRAQSRRRVKTESQDGQHLWTSNRTSDPCH